MVLHVFSYNYARINVGSHDSLSLEKTLTFYNVAIHIKSVFNKGENL